MHAHKAPGFRRFPLHLPGDVAVAGAMKAVAPHAKLLHPLIGNAVHGPFQGYRGVKGGFKAGDLRQSGVALLHAAHHFKVDRIVRGSQCAHALHLRHQRVVHHPGPGYAASMHRLVADGIQ